MNEFSLVSTDELNQIEGGKIMTAAGFTAQMPIIKLPPNGGLGATGDGGGGNGGGNLLGLIWGDGDPKLPD
jgi:bacteriocin-like protein